MSTAIAPSAVRRPRFRPGWRLCVCTALALGCLLTLGTWQLQRLAWKTELIDRAAARLGRPAVPLPTGDVDWAAYDLRHVAVQGRFVAGTTIVLGSAARDGVVGGALVAPLRLADGRVALVELGWLPAARLSAIERGRAVPGDAVRLDGIARWRGTSSPGLFTPPPDPAAGRWFAWDLPAMGDALGVELLPVVIVLDRPVDVPDPPLPAATVIDYRNEHLGYAVTWYGLAAALICVFVMKGFERGRG